MLKCQYNIGGHIIQNITHFIKTKIFADLDIAFDRVNWEKYDLMKYEIMWNKRKLERTVLKPMSKLK